MLRNVISTYSAVMIMLFGIPGRAASEMASEAPPQNAFGLASFKKLAEETPKKNIFISPLSIHSCLHMAFNGAAGETATEMGKVLDLDGQSVEKANEYHKQLIERLIGEGRKPDATNFVLETANSLWANEKIKLKPEFVEMSKKFFSAQVANLDFAKQESVTKVNTWVGEHTHGKIDKIVDHLSPEDVLILVNAAYFKARWQSVFNKASTKPAEFHTAAASEKKVPMMHINGRFSYLENEGLQAIELPYADGQTSMFVFLPPEKMGLAEFAASLSEKKWDQWLKDMSSQQGELDMPKFTMRYEKFLKDTLNALGMKEAFSGKADFSAMVVPPPPAYISDVLHKTFVKVDEEGTEAAAVTAVLMRSMGMMHEQTAKPFKMVVNRPFFFAIMDWKTHAILFVGQVTDPSEG
jgi:serpin B